MADDVASRLKGLSKAQLKAIAEDLRSVSVNSRTTAAALRKNIAQSIVSASRDAQRIEQIPGIFGTEVDADSVNRAGDRARARHEARVNAAIDKVAGGVKKSATPKRAARSHAITESKTATGSRFKQPMNSATTAAKPVEPATKVSTGEVLPPARSPRGGPGVVPAGARVSSPSRGAYGTWIDQQRALSRTADQARLGLLSETQVASLSRPSLASRAAAALGRVQTPLALIAAASQAKHAYDRAWSENKTRKEALIEAGEAAAPTVGAVVAPFVAKGAGVAGDALLGAAGALVRMHGNGAGIALSAATGGGSIAATGALAGAGVALKGLEFAGKVAGKFALPIMLGVTAYDAYRGYKKGGVQGAMMGAADSLTFGLASMAADKIKQSMAPPPPPTLWDRFKRADSGFQQRLAAPASATASIGKRRGWSPQARIASARARGATLPYGGDAANYVDPNGHS